MKKIIFLTVILICAFLGFSNPSHGIMYADGVTNILRGDTSVGNFPGYYGGQYPGGSFPIALTTEEAIAAVLGPPDTIFLSLPGAVPSTGGWPYAYVEVSFPSNFGVNDQLLITEVGESHESAHLWVWAVGGGNVQLDITRNGDDTIIVDLATLGSGFSEFYKVGIGGLDLGGSSQGFDLDAIGVSPVPEPSTMLLLGSGLVGLIGFRKKFKK